MRDRLSLLIVWGALLGVAPGCGSSPGAAPAAPAVALPSSSLVTLQGETTDLRTVLQGRAGLVTFWATWCDACGREMDALNRLAVRAAQRGDALVVGVAVGETRETVAAFAQRRGLLYAQLVDEDFRLADTLGQRSVPATLVVDRGGSIVFRGAALDGAALAAFRKAVGDVE